LPLPGERPDRRGRRQGALELGRDHTAGAEPDRPGHRTVHFVREKPVKDVVGKKVIRVVAAVVENDGLYLITQRRETAVLGLKWEFPGGKVEDNEADEDALRRELRERLDADARIGRKLGEKVHEYDGYRVALALYEATLVEGKPLHARRVKD